MAGEAAAEKDTAAEQLRFDGRPTHLQHPRGLATGAAIEIAKTNGELVAGIEAADLGAQEAQHLVAAARFLRVFAGMGEVDGERVASVGGLGFKRRMGMLPAEASPVARGVGHNCVKPGVDAGVSAEAGQEADCLEDGLLDHILGVVGTAGNAGGEAEQLRAAPLESKEKLGVELGTDRRGAGAEWKSLDCAHAAST
jgi:hypothetical protein